MGHTMSFEVLAEIREIIADIKAISLSELDHRDDITRLKAKIVHTQILRLENFLNMMESR